METKLKRSIDELDRIFTAIEDFCVRHQIRESDLFKTKLVVEELFTNLVKYNHGGDDYILLGLELQDNQIVMELTDHGVEPFDVTRSPGVDVAAPLEERRPGGLGLHLVHSYVDDLQYDYHDRTMRITAIKKLEDDDV